MQTYLISRLFLCVLLIGCPLFAQTTEPKAKPVHAFFDKTNIALFSADALVRSLDAHSTRSFMTNPCKCMKEDYLPNYIVSSSPRMYAYSLGVSAGLMGLSYLAHKTHHHKIERLIPIADIAYDGKLALGNYHMISTIHPATKTIELPAAPVQSEPVYR